MLSRLCSPSSQACRLQPWRKRRDQLQERHVSLQAAHVLSPPAWRVQKALCFVIVNWMCVQACWSSGPADVPCLLYLDCALGCEHVLLVHSVLPIDTALVKFLPSISFYSVKCRCSHHAILRHSEACFRCTHQETEPPSILLWMQS